MTLIAPDNVKRIIRNTVSETVEYSFRMAAAVILFYLAFCAFLTFFLCSGVPGGDGVTLVIKDTGELSGAAGSRAKSLS